MTLRAILPKISDRLRLGAELDVSPFCLGMTGDPGTISEAFDAGINFFFCTADMHWPLYEATRKGLADLLARGGGVREQIVVAGVSYVTQPEFCHMPFIEMVDAIPGLGHLDLTVAGGATAGEFSFRRAQFQAHRARGSRAFGASFHHRSFAAETVAQREVDIGFVRFNALHQGATTDLFPKVTERKPTLMYGFKSALYLPEERFAACGLTPNHWRPGPTDHYRFVLTHEGLDGILCALSERAHVRGLADALEAGPLGAERHSYMGDLAELIYGKARLRRDGERGEGASAA